MQLEPGAEARQRDYIKLLLPIAVPLAHSSLRLSVWSTAQQALVDRKIAGADGSVVCVHWL